VQESACHPCVLVDFSDTLALAFKTLLMPYSSSFRSGMHGGQLSGAQWFIISCCKMPLVVWAVGARTRLLEHVVASQGALQLATEPRTHAGALGRR